MSVLKSRKIFVEAPSGERFEADVPCGTPLSRLAADFFEAQGWPMQDIRGRGQRAVVDLVNPHNPDDSKRLNGELDVCKAGLKDGDTLRVNPESIAATVNQSDRLTALISDHNELLDLQLREPRIHIAPNRTHAPDDYVITLRYPSFVEWLPGDAEPRRGEEHRVRLSLGADYPRAAPQVRWQSAIFHPNIRPDLEFVCIGELSERWRPGLGLARLVLMLVEMIQYRNFNPIDGCNRDACLWAADPSNRVVIESIGGHPFQGPLEQFLRATAEADRSPVVFKRI